MTAALSLEDRAAIGDVLSRYCHYWDSGDGERWASLFLDDARCIVPGVSLQGREQLRGMPAMGAAAGGGKFRHQITNILVEPGIGSDTADVLAYGLMTDWREGGKLLMLATYRVRMTRTGEGWRIESLVAEPA